MLVPTAFLATLWLNTAVPPGAESPPVRVYTNADLERVEPLRHQTGVLTEPGPRARPEPAPAEPAQPDEGHWRKEAARLRERLRPLREKAADLRQRIDERWRLPGVAPLSDAQLGRWRSALRDLEERIAESERRFAERARRARALPGWLR
jgi:hypothetical protein